MEMQKRRERIEQWRAERNKVKEIIPINIAPPSKKWSLEDDDDDDDDVGGNKNDGDDDELDPLDAYMQVKFGGFFFFFFFRFFFFFFRCFFFFICNSVGIFIAPIPMCCQIVH